MKTAINMDSIKKKDRKTAKWLQIFNNLEIDNALKIWDIYMGHEHAGHYASKHPEGAKPDSNVLEAVKELSIDGKISCYTALKLADNLKVQPETIGMAIDFLEIKISKCQLGLFGYVPDKKIVRMVDTVKPELEKNIKSRLVGNKLTCIDAWGIAEESNIKKMDVSDACETLKIKIFKCQLGAF